MREEWENARTYSPCKGVVITDVEQATDAIRRSFGSKVPKHFVLETQPLGEPIYFDKNFKEVSDPKEAELCWIDTGLERQDGRKVFISLLKKGEQFEGYFAGESFYLFRKVVERGERSAELRENFKTFQTKHEPRFDLESFYKINEAQGPEADSTAKSSVKKELLSSLRDRLLVDNFITEAGFKRYLLIIGARLYQMEKEGTAESNGCYIKSDAGAVVNTGLLDKFRQDIYMYYRAYPESYFPDSIIDSKAGFIAAGFDRVGASTVLAPIEFYDSVADKFEVTGEDIDINYRSLTHIIDERRERFPASVFEMASDQLAQKIKSSLELGIKMQQRDPSYAKPSYSAKTKSVSWLIPLHIESSLNEEPELVIALRKAGDFYETKTVLPYDDCMKDKIRALGLYNGLW